MASFNQVILLGNLTRDPELKYTPKGTAFATTGLAVNRVYNDDQGNKHEEVTFVDIEFWGRTAEVLNEYCKKGKQIMVEGRLKLDQWDDKQTGQKRSKIKVVGETLQMLGDPKGERTERGGEYNQEQPPTRRSAPPPPRDPDLDAPEDDIPF